MMNERLITKIVGNILPEDIVREISSYFIQKIQKDDIRRKYMEYFLFDKLCYLSQGFYPDGEFHYNLVQYSGSQTRYFLLRIFPKLFIEYNFCMDDRISSIRFWMKGNKCEVPVDGYWIEKT